MNILKRFSSKNIAYLILTILSFALLLLSYFANRPVGSIRNLVILFGASLIAIWALEQGINLIILKLRKDFISLNNILIYLFLTFTTLSHIIIYKGTFSTQFFIFALFFGILLILLKLPWLQSLIAYFLFILISVFLTGQYVFLVSFLPLFFVYVINEKTIYKPILFLLYKLNSRRKKTSRVQQGKEDLKSLPKEKKTKKSKPKKSQKRR